MYPIQIPTLLTFEIIDTNISNLARPHKFDFYLFLYLNNQINIVKNSVAEILLVTKFIYLVINRLNLFYNFVISLYIVQNCRGVE